MLPGTKKIFGDSYEEFKSAMIHAAEFDELPVGLQHEDPYEYTMKDLQQLFFEFNRDTSLEMTGAIYMCPDCKKLHLILEVNYSDDKDKILQ